MNTGERHRAERRLAAILAADIAGYSRLIGVDEEGTLSGLRDLDQRQLYLSGLRLATGEDQNPNRRRG